MAEGALRVMAKYGRVHAGIVALGLQRVWAQRPLLDGRKVLAALPHLQRGPRVGRAMELQLHYQLMNPRADAGVCTAFLQAHAELQPG